MKKEYSMAVALLETATTAFANAQKAAISVLKTVLYPVGEHGVSITPLDDLYDDEFVCFAEQFPFEFKPVTLVRYNEKNRKVEVFISEWDKEKKVVYADGRWVDIEEAHVDTHFLLDEVITNLEWADYYDDEDED